MISVKLARPILFENQPKMQLAATTPEEILSLAIEVVRKRQPQMTELLDALPAPVYATDAEGRVTYFNQACIDFAGRTPVPGQDLWCVTWKLYTEDGQFLPHDQCPMAVAIQEKRAVRGVEAVAERPDGSRVNFRPFPTPLLNEEGEIVGAVNLLVDITNVKQADYLRKQAQRCRRLARSVDDQATGTTLKRMAEEYENKASSLGRLH